MKTLQELVKEEKDIRLCEFKNNHLQVQNIKTGTVVNYYPQSKKKTVYIVFKNGDTNALSHCSPQEVIDFANTEV